VLPGIIGLIQATETLKLIIGAGESLAGRLLHFDALKMKFREFTLRRDPQCPVCGDAPTVFEPIDYEQFCAGPPAEDDWFAAPDEVPVISVRELKAKMENDERFTLIDVREPYEYEIARIEGSRLIPLGELEARSGELPREGMLVLQCHSGGRSEHAVRLLQQAGFENAMNLEGGIDAWSVEIDPAVPRY
jgi:adenylyltransferase/sulfurtransferase